VSKAAALRCQLREHLQAAWPGYEDAFGDIWKGNVPFCLLRRFDTPAAVRAAGLPGLVAALRQDGVRFQTRTLQAVLAWAEQAAPADVGAAVHRRVALALEGDRLQKTQEILGLERDLARCLAGTPYVLLLTLPGVNVVTAADFAGEMGPIERYANARAITGRAGLRPSRHQSDQVDRPNGPLVRCANRRLRFVILNIADNLILCNNHFRALAAAGGDPRRGHVRVANRFCRIAYQLVAGRQVLRHPAIKERGYLLDKLLAFHREHETAAAQALADVQAAVEQLPRDAYHEEARPLAEELERLGAGRRRGPQPLGEVLPIVLARLGVAGVESGASGEAPR
jgi:hypothetical protein